MNKSKNDWNAILTDVAKLLSAPASVVAICNKHGIERATLYEGIKRYTGASMEELKDIIGDDAEVIEAYRIIYDLIQQRDEIKRRKG